MTAAAGTLTCDCCGRSVIWRPGQRELLALPPGWRAIAEQDHGCPDCTAPMDAPMSSTDSEGTQVPPPPRTLTDSKGLAVRAERAPRDSYQHRHLAVGDRVRREHKLDGTREQVT